MRKSWNLGFIQIGSNVTGQMSAFLLHGWAARRQLIMKKRFEIKNCARYDPEG